MTKRIQRQRAIRAARAVTLAGVIPLATAACGGGDVNRPSAEVPEVEPDSTECAEPARTATAVDSSTSGPVGPIALPEGTELLQPEAIGSAAEQAENVCSKERDGKCPDGCTRDNDADCCETAGESGGMWCSYSSDWGCSCAIEGPFAPPT